VKAISWPCLKRSSANSNSARRFEYHQRISLSQNLFAVKSKPV
jgi:hypothetical protein